MKNKPIITKKNTCNNMYLLYLIIIENNYLPQEIDIICTDVSLITFGIIIENNYLPLCQEFALMLWHLFSFLAIFLYHLHIELILVMHLIHFEY